MEARGYTDTIQHMSGLRGYIARFMDRFNDRIKKIMERIRIPNYITMPSISKLWLCKKIRKICWGKKFEKIKKKLHF